MQSLRTIAMIHFTCFKDNGHNILYYDTFHSSINKTSIKKRQICHISKIVGQISKSYNNNNRSFLKMFVNE